MRYKQAADYRERLRNLALDYYHRRISFITFRVRMVALIGSGLADAWMTGREFVGLTAESGLRFSERMALYREVSREIRYLHGLTTAIDRLASEARNVDVINRRLDLWGDAFVRTQELSKVFNGGDQMLEWTLHPAEHCVDCIALSGQRRTARDWLGAGLYPKSWQLACHQGCKCSLNLVG